MKISDKPYYVLAGGYDTRNVGDYAMLDFLKRKLDQVGCNIQLLARHDEQHLKDIYGVSELISNYEYNNKEESVDRFFRGLNHGEDSRHLVNLKNKLESSQGLIIGGGRLLIDHTADFMRGPLAYFATLVMLCRFLGVPIYVYAMTIVPCKSEEGSKWLKFIIDNCEKVSVRDKESVEVLRSIGCVNTEIKVIPDPAYGLLWGKKLLHSNKKLTAGLTVRAIHEKWGGMSSNSYIQKMASLVKLLKDNNIHVVGIPHQYYGIDDSRYDDRNILNEIAKYVDFEVINDEILDLKKYQTIYQELDILVGIRRHSFIFSAVSGVPVFPFSENPNAARACSELGVEDVLALSESFENYERKLKKFLSIKDKRLIIQNEKMEELKNRLELGYSDWFTVS